MEYLRRAGKVIVERRRTMVTLSLLLYISLYLAVSFTGINFQAQPALAGYHTPPSVLTGAPRGGQVMGMDTFDVGVDVNDPDAPQDVEADIRDFDAGTHWGNSTCTANCWANISRTFSDGDYNWEAQVCDQNNGGDPANCTGWQGPWSFTVDTQAPSVSVSINTSNPGLNEQVRITADADDPAPATTVQQIRVYVNATQVDSCTTGSDPASCVVDVGPYAEGSAHSFNATATDEGGNTGSSSIQEFNVNSRPNDPTNPNPADTAMETDDTPDINVTYTDPNGENGYVEFDVNTTTGLYEDSCNSVSDGGTCGIITSSLSDGLHEWNATAFDSHDDSNPAPSPTWTFTVDSSANTQVTGPSESTYHSSDFTVTVDDDDDATKCQYRIDDTGGGDTGWVDRSCPDGGFTVDVGSGGDCNTEGTDTCIVEVNMTDGVGNSATDTASFDVDTTAPGITCGADCAAPDPVKSGTPITFAPTVTDGGSGTDLVEICETASCTDTYCTYSPNPPGESSCNWPSPDATFETRQFCVRATDQSGNQNVQCADPQQHNFTVKKWVGDSCQADQECLLGACSGGQCRVTIIPPPSIILTSFSETTDVQRASLGPAPAGERPRTVPAGRVRTMNVTLSNPLTVPDRLYVSFEGSALSRGLVGLQDVEQPGLSCSAEEAQCIVLLGSEAERTVQIPIRGVQPSRGMLQVTVTSATSEKSASAGMPIVVRQESPFTFFRGLFDNLF